MQHDGVAFSRIQVVSILTLIAAAVALNTVLNREDTEESSGGWTDDLHAVTVGLIVAASATIIAETLFLPVAKWGHYIYAPVSLMHLCIVLAVSTFINVSSDRAIKLTSTCRIS